MKDPDSDLEDELSFHLEMRIRELIDEGLSDAEAGKEARRRFGDLCRIRAQCRQIRREGETQVKRAAYLEQLRQDVVYGIRQLSAARGFSAIAILTLALASIGVYGVIGYLASRRAHEIGVRMALGARARDVVVLVVKQAMIPVAAGMALGVMGALAGAGFLESQLFGIQANDPWTFLAVAALLAIVALAASYIPARRISRVDPKASLYQA